MPKKLKAIRWTISEASAEFKIDRHTLAKRVKVQGIEIGKDGKLSTAQVCSAIYGDWDGEKLRKIRHEANLLAIEEKQEIGELIPRKNAVRLWSEVIALLREKIMGTTRLTEEERRDILAGLRDIPPTEYFRDDREIEENSETP